MNIAKIQHYSFFFSNTNTCPPIPGKEGRKIKIPTLSYHKNIENMKKKAEKEWEIVKKEIQIGITPEHWIIEK